MTRTFATAAAALAIALVAAEAAHACSCVAPRPREQLKRADGAIVGRLLAVRVVDPPEEGEPISSGDPTDFVYRVGRVYKHGPGLRRGRRVKVRSVRGEATCGLPHGRGRLYGLFLGRRDGRWRAGLCDVVSPRDIRRAAASRNPRPGDARRGRATGCREGRAIG
jgi:hypothetical protein